MALESSHSADLTGMSGFGVDADEYSGRALAAMPKFCPTESLLIRFNQIESELFSNRPDQLIDFKRF